MYRIVTQNVLLVRGASLSFSAAASTKPIQLHQNTSCLYSVIIFETKSGSQICQ